MIDDEHSNRRSHGQREIGGQKKIAETLPPMILWADVGDQCKCGCMEEGQSNPLKDSYCEKRPERRGQEVGKGGEGKEKGPSDHKGFFRNP